MKIAIIGAGAVGGYYGALLSRTGADVSFVARGAHRDAIRANGLRIIGVQGDFTVRVPAEDDPSQIGPVDVVILTVKTYDNGSKVVPSILLTPYEVDISNYQALVVDSGYIKAEELK